MKTSIFLLLFTSILVSCNLEKFSEEPPKETNENNVQPNSYTRPEFIDSARRLILANHHLRNVGHQIPQALEDLEAESLNWMDHKILIEVGKNEYKTIDWVPGYVYSHHRGNRVIYKNLDLQTFEDIEKKMKAYLSSSKAHYNSYKQDLDETTLRLMELQYILVEETLDSYMKKIEDLRTEGSKIKTMTWNEILRNWNISDIVWTDTGVDLLSLANFIIEDNQDELAPLEREGRIRLLKASDTNKFPPTQNFQVYEKYFIYIQ